MMEQTHSVISFVNWCVISSTTEMGKIHNVLFENVLL
jgi:hypothetical protein